MTPIYLKFANESEALTMLSVVEIDGEIEHRGLLPATQPMPGVPAVMLDGWHVDLLVEELPPALKWWQEFPSTPRYTWAGYQ